MEIVPFGGWARNARFTLGDLELLVTLEVGPRIIRFGRIGGPNEMAFYEKDAGKTGGEECRSYGGHRLWIAPEERVRTLQPDNEPVEVIEEDDGWYSFKTPTDVNQVQKEIRLRVNQEKGGFDLEHRLYNHSPYTLDLCPWVLSVMAPGGVALFPQEEFISHADKVLPARPLVLWHYTKLGDPRWTWGDRLVRLRQDAGLGSMKVGALVKAGYAAYANHGNLFLKRFPFDPSATYADYGVNFEVYTRQDMLEVESLGALESVLPGAYASHREAWYLLADVQVPDGDSEAADWLDAIVQTRPL